ncbi:cytochrome d ubiquinol oxidase subunit II [Propionibacteriaceae bacterium Y1700]|uniref:cytochrome d ubiquinol oxidase subunit II n=1 Tax=Microlunatus sp. Y1700 TaxID=3418487 RepID=UPI003DA6DF7B
MEFTTLQIVWFVLVAVLFVGYFVLEGFDFGVGMLLPFLAKDEKERRVMINTIGPVWDGNEVWILVAGGAMFAAFPEWYATLFSGFYLPLLLILVGLIVRGVAFEYRGKREDPAWRRRWDAAIIVGSALPALLWGVAFGNIVAGVPLDADHEYVGGFFTLLNPFALLAGVVTVTLFVTHGAIFIALKTVGDIRGRARRFAGRVGVVAAVALLGFAAWYGFAHSNTPLTWVTTAVAALALVGGLMANALGREGWAFLGTAVTIAATVATLFLGLFPAVMPSTIDPAFTLHIGNASSAAYTLSIMTVAAAIFTPIVLLYQGWTYWVFRKRIGVQHMPDPVPAPREAEA